MGFLDEIGSGFRSGLLAGAAGMSNEVFREQGQAIARRKEHDQNRQAKVAEIMLQAAHSGQIPDEHLPELQRSLKRMGYDLPVEALQATPEARAKLAEYARIKSADEAGARLGKFGQIDQPEGLGLPDQGLRGNAPAPLPQVPMPPRPQGMPPDQSANPPGVQTFPLAPPDTQKGTPSPEQPFSQAQQDRIGDMEAQTQAFGEDPAHPAQMQPNYPPISMKVGEVGQLPPVEVVGRRPAEVSRGTIPPIVQDTVTPQAIAQAIPPGTSKVDLQKWYAAALDATGLGRKGADKVLEHVLKLMNPGKSELITVGKGQTIFDPRTGKAVFHGEPEELKAVQEFNAMLDQSGITDPAARQKMWADYTSRKGSGVTVNTGQPKAPAGFRYSEDGTTLEAIKGGPADELDSKQKAIVIGVKNTKDAIKEYRTKLNAMSTIDYAFPNNRARLQTSYSAMLLLAKEAFNLGVLNPNDRVIMAEIIRNPLDLNSTFLTKDTLDEQGATLDKMMDIMERNASKVRPQDASTTQPKAAAAPETMTVPSGKHKGEYFKKDGEWLKK